MSIDELEENEMETVQEFVPGYKMKGVPQNSKELLQHYTALVLSDKPVGTVYVGNDPMDLSQVVNSETPNNWNKTLLPSSVEELCMDAGDLQITMTQPIDLETERKHWEGKGYEVKQMENMTFILKGTTMFRIEDGIKVCVDQHDMPKYLKGMRSV